MPINNYAGYGHRRMVIILVLALIMGFLFAIARPRIDLKTSGVEAAGGPSLAGQAVNELAAVDPVLVETVLESSEFLLAPFFTDEVLHWAPDIMRWSAAYGLDPNIIAIIMQVESCGDPQAISSAGAMGLFQVMPFHFSAGEDGFDPETNSRRGLNYFLGRMDQTGGDVGLSFAGYNGGHVAAGTTWDHWAAETQRYYVWTTGIFQDVNSNQTESETLGRWLQAGGASLCQQAAARLGLG
jgi:soluble lytic murein transglycosylase-like protein